LKITLIVCLSFGRYTKAEHGRKTTQARPYQGKGVIYNGKTNYNIPPPLFVLERVTAPPCELLAPPDEDADRLEPTP